LLHATVAVRTELVDHAAPPGQPYGAADRDGSVAGIAVFVIPPPDLHREPLARAFRVGKRPLVIIAVPNRIHPDWQRSFELFLNSGRNRFPLGEMGDLCIPPHEAISLKSTTPETPEPSCPVVSYSLPFQSKVLFTT
jgi:hypothetical protein